MTVESDGDRIILTASTNYSGDLALKNTISYGQG